MAEGIIGLDEGSDVTSITTSSAHDPDLVEMERMSALSGTSSSTYSHIQQHEQQHHHYQYHHQQQQDPRRAIPLDPGPAHPPAPPSILLPPADHLAVPIRSRHGHSHSSNRSSHSSNRSGHSSGHSSSHKAVVDGLIRIVDSDDYYDEMSVMTNSSHVTHGTLATTHASRSSRRSRGSGMSVLSGRSVGSGASEMGDLPSKRRNQVKTYMRTRTAVSLRDLDKEIIRAAQASGAEVLEPIAPTPGPEPHVGFQAGRDVSEDHHSDAESRGSRQPRSHLTYSTASVSSHDVTCASRTQRSMRSGAASTRRSVTMTSLHSPSHGDTPATAEEIAATEEVLVGAGVKPSGTRKARREAYFWQQTRRPIDSELERIRRAALFIEDAVSSRPIKVTRLGPRPIAAYRFYHNKWYRRFFVAVVLLHMALAFFEPPWMGEDPASGPSAHGPLLAIEALCILVYVFDMGLDIYAEGLRAFFQYNWHYVHMFTVVTMVVDLIAAVAGSPLRVTRIIRWIPLVENTVTLKHLLYCTFYTVGKLYDMVVIVAVLLITFAIVGVQMFGLNEVSPSAIAVGSTNTYRDEQGKPLDGNFDNTGEALLSLLVLLSTENYPDIMYPALKASPLYAGFFILFILIGIFILFSVLTAIIFDTYKEIHEVRVIAARVQERKGLIAAFQVLDKNRTGYMHTNQWVALMAEWKPSMSMERACFLFKTMDHDGDNTIDLLEFFDILEIMRYEIEEVSVEPKDSWLTRACALNLPLVRRIVDSSVFSWFIVVCIIVNVGILCLYRSSMSRSEFDLYERIDIAFVAIFTLEQLLKALGYGMTDYWADYWNRFDLSIVVLSLTTVLLEAGSEDNKSASSIFVSLRVLRLFRTLRTVRLLSTAREFETLMQTFLHLGYVVVPISTCVAVAFYSYAILGMELFGGKMSPSQVADADPYTDFATFPRTLLALFQLFTTSNWHEIMYTAREGAGRVSALYFVSFFIVMILLFNNILLAIVFEIFSFQRTRVEQEERSKARVAFMDKTFQIKQGGRTWDRDLVTTSLDELKRQEIAVLQETTNVDLEDIRSKQVTKRQRLLGLDTGDTQGSHGFPSLGSGGGGGGSGGGSGGYSGFAYGSGGGGGGGGGGSGGNGSGGLGSAGHGGNGGGGGPDAITTSNPGTPTSAPFTLATFNTAVANVSRANQREQDRLREMASIVRAKRAASRKRSRMQSQKQHRSRALTLAGPRGSDVHVGAPGSYDEAIGSSRGFFPPFSFFRKRLGSGSSGSGSSSSASDVPSSNGSSSSDRSDRSSVSSASFRDPALVLAEMLAKRATSGPLRPRPRAKTALSPVARPGKSVTFGSSPGLQQSSGIPGAGAPFHSHIKALHISESSTYSDGAPSDDALSGSVSSDSVVDPPVVDSDQPCHSRRSRRSRRSRTSLALTSVTDTNQPLVLPAYDQAL